MPLVPVMDAVQGGMVPAELPGRGCHTEGQEWLRPEPVGLSWALGGSGDRPTATAAAGV